MQIPFSTGILDIQRDPVPMPNNRKEGYGNALQQVPVIIVGSHYDLILDGQKEAVSSVQSLVNEVRFKYVCQYSLD